MEKEKIVSILKTLFPVKRLDPQTLAQLSQKAAMLSIPSGQVIFKEGASDRKTFFLIQGTVLLKATGGPDTVLKASMPISKRPIHNFQPRKCSGIISEKAVLLQLDNKVLDLIMTWEQTSKIKEEPTETSPARPKAEPNGSSDSEDTTNNWMRIILQSEAFMQVPPTNIQAMFTRLEEVGHKKGDAIIKQGDKGDYFYLIKNGTCRVTRTIDNKKSLTLADLHPGDTFGEEALLSEGSRNANVTMTSNGRLMRLAKKDFNALLRAPLLKWVSNKEAHKMVKEDMAVWLDVRLESEHEDTGIEGSINIPLFMLRLKADTLDPKKKYILYCDSGRRSSVGAYLLTERGIEAYCLRGGLQADPDV